MAGKQKAYVIGCGGQSRVILSILKEIDKFDVLGILDSGADFNSKEKILGFPVIGTIAHLESIKKGSNYSIFLGIGDNQKRCHIFEHLKSRKFSFPNLISPHSLVDRSASLGSGNVICPFAFVGPLVKIGNNNILNTRSVLEHDSLIASNSHIAPGAIICGSTEIGSDCFIGVGSVILNDLCISSGTVIGAASTVLSNITETDSTYIGTPARILNKKNLTDK